jgi:hypothetical protein
MSPRTRRLLYLASVALSTTATVAWLVSLHRNPTEDLRGPSALERNLAQTPLALPGAPLPGSAPLVAGASRAANPESSKPASHQSLVFRFLHSTDASHSDGEACQRHRNFLKIDWQPFASKVTTCVRVDGRPVAHERTQEGLLLGPDAGPRSKIEVTVCTTASADECTKKCSKPKDAVLGALGVDEADLKAGWDSPSAAEGQAKLSSLEKQLQQELADHADLEIYSGWQPAPQVVPAHSQLASQQ